MTQVIDYHRPTELAEALRLLGRTDAPSRVLAGGTSFAGVIGSPAELVDLQALGLDGISGGTSRISIGSMARLQDLVEHPLVPTLLRELARRELPSTLRTLATVGGTIGAATWESELIAGLLVHDTVVSLRSATDAFDAPLPEVLAHRSAMLPGRIITGITLAVDGPSAVARTGRTPGDVSIVSAVGRKLADGRTRLALTGVAATPVLVDDVSHLDPPSDFRGSSEYRRSLATTLLNRVLAELGV
jgi:CO/xanthine dehydrogenase FAD-binding subunit